MSLRFKTLILFALPVTAAIAACGGADVGDLFDPPGATSDGGSQLDANVTTDSEPPPPPADGAAPDSGTDLDTGTPPVRDTGIPDTGIADTGIADTGIADSGRDSPRVIDDSNGTLCGSAVNPTYCDNAASYCCASRPMGVQGVQAFNALTCNPDGVPCNNNFQAQFNCDGPEDCTGADVCCGEYVWTSPNRFPNWDNSTCETRLNCRSGRFTVGANPNREVHEYAILCKVGAVPSECPPTLTCVSSPSVPIYGFCQ